MRWLVIALLLAVSGCGSGGNGGDAGRHPPFVVAQQTIPDNPGLFIDMALKAGGKLMGKTKDGWPALIWEEDIGTKPMLHLTPQTHISGSAAAHTVAPVVTQHRYSKLTCEPLHTGFFVAVMDDYTRQGVLIETQKIFGGQENEAP